jgi:hypothetical protein
MLVSPTTRNPGSSEAEDNLSESTGGGHPPPPGLGPDKSQRYSVDSFSKKEMIAALKLGKSSRSFFKIPTTISESMLS